MADTIDAVQLTPTANGVEVTLPGLTVAQGGTPLPVAILKPTDTQAITVQVNTPPESNVPYIDVLIFVALVVPLALTSLLGTVIVVKLLCRQNMAKTLDKLAQMLSEEDSQKMSFSRVQALIFTYVIGFGCLLIIARTGQFPVAIPDDLAILSGGSLATYVLSKAIQKQGQ